MKHCKTDRNGCRGISDCFCECERCLDADNAAGAGTCGHGQCDCPDGVFYGREEVSDADPGL